MGPRAAALGPPHMAPDPGREGYTVCCTLARAVPDAAHLEAIRDAVRRTHRCTLLATELLNLYVRDRLENHDGAGLERLFDANWLIKAFYLVFNNSRPWEARRCRRRSEGRLRHAHARHPRRPVAQGSDPGAAVRVRQPRGRRVPRALTGTNLALDADRKARPGLLHPGRVPARPTSRGAVRRSSTRGPTRSATSSASTPPSVSGTAGRCSTI